MQLIKKCVVKTILPNYCQSKWKFCYKLSNNKLHFAMVSSFKRDE